LNILFDLIREMGGFRGVIRPLSALFVDCDAFFASVEQHLDPALRGRPVGVIPVCAESTCCIASSYEAKAFGVKTGTRVSEARKMCPGIVMVESKPEEYIRMHHRIVAAVEECIHVEAVLSIDEMWAWLPYNLREPSVIEGIAARIKQRVAEVVSPVIQVSIGAGPNRFLAKMASKMGKPNGYVCIEAEALPAVLHELSLGDLTGVGRSIEARLHAAGIHDVESLCRAPKGVLRGVWGGVVGERFWHLLRGDELPEMVSARKSLSHSHVLPPQLRKPEKAWAVLCKLLHKACERMRSHQLLAGRLALHLVDERGEPWSAEIGGGESDGTLVWLSRLKYLWSARPEPRRSLVKVGVVLADLCEMTDGTGNLPLVFDDPAAGVDVEKQKRLDVTLDRLRARYGRSVVFFGGVEIAEERAPMRISFTHIPDLQVEKD
jgi:DNA polymerase-4